MNVFTHLKSLVIEALESLAEEAFIPADLPFTAIAVELPKDPKHGDLACNAAMVLAGRAGLKPRDLAEAIKKKLQNTPNLDHVEIAGPGFMNFTFQPCFWQSQIPVILKAGAAYGRSNIGDGLKVNVEYVSANPTGPMHIGHARGAVFGDALANLLSATGFDVTREYYINDAGSQVDTLARSAFLRYQEALDQQIAEIPEGLYPGDYLKPVGKMLAEKFSDKYLNAAEFEWLGLFRSLAIIEMMQSIRRDLAEMGVNHDVFFSERNLHDEKTIEKCLAEFRTQGLIYEGVLEPPKGKPDDDWEPREQTLFRATQFGDDTDRPLMKSDGSYTYFAADIAYHWDKVKRGYTQLINVLGADHGGYVKRLKAAVNAASSGKTSLDVKLVQLVNLMENGQPVKMSKRSGTFVTLREVVEEVGKDVVRFIMLTRSNDATLDFDLAKVKEMSRENPVFYVQYAHARACSILRNATESMPDAVRESEHPSSELLAHLNHPYELQIIRKLCSWPNLVEGAAKQFEPHRLCFYLQELAADFHGFWTLGKEMVDLKFIVVEDSKLTSARLGLVRAVRSVIASGLNLIGVEPVEELRG
jgi:arginyl-tRNA synthetase